MGIPLRPPGTGEQRRLIADEAGRIDAVIAAADPGLTRARVQRLIEDGLVFLNGEPVRKSARLDPGDTIDYELPVLTRETLPTGLQIPVLYEDDCLVVVDKPAGLNTHGGPNDDVPSLAAWFAEHYLTEPSTFDSERPGIVHRLDKDTTGVLVLARTPEVQAALSHSFEQREVVKIYVALTDAVPARERALIDAPIGRHPGERTRMAVVSRGRPARTRYEVKGSSHSAALLEVSLETGRTHQVRVHLAAINAPVMGDAVYGRANGQRQALHAWHLEIPHPRGGRLAVTAILPADMRETARSLGLQNAAMPYCEARPASCSPDIAVDNETPGNAQ